jgi:hypothetical protein
MKTRDLFLAGNFRPVDGNSHFSTLVLLAALCAQGAPENLQCALPGYDALDTGDVWGCMVVGTGLIDLRIVGCASLKEKRSVLSRILRRTRNEFNVSIAEVGDNDRLQRARIGFCAVGNDKPYINAKVDHILRFVDQMGLAEIIRSRIEIESFSDLLEGPEEMEEGKYD